MSLNKVDIILASGSPRRKKLLEELGYKFVVEKSSAEELHDESMEPRALCEENAKIKAQDVASKYPNKIVIGADTLVFLGNMPLGKPKSKAEAIETLKMLSDKEHYVCTGVSIVYGEMVETFSELTKVMLKQLNDSVIEDYMSKVNVMDKAGSYAIQEHGDMIVLEAEGDYSNVVGLPQSLVHEKLQAIFAKV